MKAGLPLRLVTARASCVTLLAAAGALSCGSGEDGGASAVGEATTDADFFAAQPSSNGPVLDTETSSPSATAEMPRNFTPADRGGWELGGEASGDTAQALPRAGRQDGCGSILTGVIRDFSVSHPDFGGEISGLQRGLVRERLGGDGKPVLSDDYEQGFIQSEASFHQWYTTVPGISRAFYLALSLAPNDDTFGFESHDFFPLDGAGFGNENEDRNFYFTFELHTVFRYAGGEVFRFSGDDDLWVFVNGQLAIDLGGVHDEQDETLDLDDAAGRLGIEPGSEYTLDFFQAERHVTESNFQIETTLEFTSCGAAMLR
jgi:fibro-slime domain-containing protein